MVIGLATLDIHTRLIVDYTTSHGALREINHLHLAVGVVIDISRSTNDNVRKSNSDGGVPGSGPCLGGGCLSHGEVDQGNKQENQSSATHRGGRKEIEDHQGIFLTPSRSLYFSQKSEFFRLTADCITQAPVPVTQPLDDVLRILVFLYFL